MKKNALFIAGLLLLASCGSQVPQNQSPENTGVAAQGYNQCASQWVPSGSVVTSYFYSSACGSGFTKNTYTIENLSGLSSFNGACSLSLPPSGWVITSYFYASQCSTQNAGFEKNAYNLVNTAYNTQINGVCNISSIPFNWTITSSYYSSACATQNSGFQSNTYNIRKN